MNEVDDWTRRTPHGTVRMSLSQTKTPETSESHLNLHYNIFYTLMYYLLIIFDGKIFLL